MKPNLQKLVAEGFEEKAVFGSRYAYYSKDKTDVFYDLVKDKEIIRYSLGVQK